MPWFDLHLLLKITHWVRHKWNPGILPLSPALPTQDSSWQLISSIISVFRGCQSPGCRIQEAVTSVPKNGKNSIPCTGLWVTLHTYRLLTETSPLQSATSVLNKGESQLCTLGMACFLGKISRDIPLTPLREHSASFQMWSLLFSPGRTYHR